ncbi:MAG: hypothetical protein QM820_62415 [Minicystis sp.]
MRLSVPAIAGALLLAACQSSTGPAPAPTSSGAAKPAAAAASSSAVPPAVHGPAPITSVVTPPSDPADAIPDKLPPHASIHFEWFAFGAESSDAHKLWLETSVAKKTTTLSYVPDKGAGPPGKEISAATREAVVRVVEATKISAWEPARPGKPGQPPKWSYLLEVSWQREGKPTATLSTAWADTSETPELAAVRKAILDLGASKFPAVARSAPKP